MKLLLLSTNTTRYPYPVYPLGLDHIAGTLAPGHEVDILDMNVVGGLEPLGAAIRNFDPGIIGLSIRNIDNSDTLGVKSFVQGYEEIIRFIRCCTKAPVVLGGSGFSIFPGELMTRLDADFGVVGEGEVLGMLLDALERGEGVAGLPGVISRGGDDRGPVAWTGGLRRRFRPPDAQLQFYLKRGGILNLQTKRGCPFRCIYCTYPRIEGSRLRMSAPEEVAREARGLQEKGARYLFITDSVFNSDYAHSMAVAAAFRRQGVTLPWGAFFATTRPPDGYYASLAEAGLTHVEFGTETLCDGQLGRYGKPFCVKDVMVAHESALAAGVHIAHYLLLGGPGEEASTLEETMKRMEELRKAVFFVFCGLRIFPHTPLYEIALKEGQIAPDQDLLTPVFYHSGGIGTREILSRVQAQARGRLNWVYGDGGQKSERIVARMHAHGHTGPLWELLIQ
ncbi:MAG: radical SAM protein [Deltaproteobacteria bacterium]|nr:radical SAM protein [Deltaproteobacteria bacterium]